MNSQLNKKALTSQQCYITLVHTSYKKKLLAISDKVLIIKHSNIAEGQLERRRKDMTNLILLAVVIRIIVSIIVVDGNAYCVILNPGLPDRNLKEQVTKESKALQCNAVRLFYT